MYFLVLGKMLGKQTWKNIKVTYVMFMEKIQSEQICVMIIIQLSNSSP